MKRLLALALLLAACSQNTTGTPVEVTSHCGLDDATVEYEDKRWKFADVGDGANAPQAGASTPA